MTALELEKYLREEKLDSIYVLYGKEKFLLESSVKKIKRLFGAIVDGLNYIKIDSESVDRLIQELQTPAFGYEKKLVIVKDSELFAKSGKKRGQQFSDKADNIASFFEDNLDMIKEQNIVLFIEDEVEKNALYKVLEPVSVVCNFEQEKVPELAKRIKMICNAYSVNIDNYVLNYFIECCGTNLLDLINEIRKLIEYVGKGGTIKKEDIDVLSTRQLESVIFDLTDSLAQRNIDKALTVYRNLIYAKEPPQKILVTLYNHFKKIYIAQLCETCKADTVKVLGLKPNQTFLVSKYKRQASYFKNGEIKNLLYQMIDLDEKYKIGLIDLNLGIETIICGYVGK